MTQKTTKSLNLETQPQQQTTANFSLIKCKLKKNVLQNCEISRKKRYMETMRYRISTSEIIFIILNILKRKVK